ncbi:IscS subfamily cysteine desulfurase [Bacillus sp. REN10]|uniref:IscS subfamily cysteine desulfurase n=1 Tax=Bacillus sp. REN10 TaxID=2782541 RepID=UPI00193B22A5|nr:IscS subfamily cysteine desulfurase [Bacillus sp. REN10]
MPYFDYAATTPMCEEALNVYIEASRKFFGNSSSLHDEGGRARFLLDSCREKLATLIGGQPEGVYFTSSGTESNLLAVISLAKQKQPEGTHIITTMAEHSSVHAAMNYLEQEGFQITRLPFNSEGVLDIQTLEDAITEETVLVCLQYVNSEIGTIQPVIEAGMMLKEKGILLHCDCVQAFGKIDLQPLLPSITSLSISSHKIYGPKGVGAAYVSPSIPWRPIFPGISHEKGFRGGTVDVPGIAAFIAAAEKMCQSYSLDKEWKLRQRLKEQLAASSYEWIETKHERQLPSIIGMKLMGTEGQLMMLHLNEYGFSISTGSACQSSNEGGTKAVQAMGFSKEEAKQFFRISFGEQTTIAEVDALAKRLLENNCATIESIEI